MAEVIVSEPEEPDARTEEAVYESAKATGAAEVHQFEAQAAEAEAKQAADIAVSAATGQAEVAERASAAADSASESARVASERAEQITAGQEALAAAIAQLTEELRTSRKPSPPREEKMKPRIEKKPESVHPYYRPLFKGRGQ